MIVVFMLLISFFMGSIPVGYLIVKKVKGVDIRTFGSGNIGSTNVKRIAGDKVAKLTQAFDVLKGIMPVGIAFVIANFYSLPISKDLFVSTVALAAVVGHCYTPFLGFNGGKGVNTTLGAFILVAPVPVLVGFATYMIMTTFVKVVSVRSITAAASLPVTALIMGLPAPITIAIFLVTGLMVLRHKDNIKRLVKKEEK